MANLMGARREIIRHGLVGFALALGAPLGWLFWRTAGHEMLAELSDNMALYGYLLVGTSIAFVSFGALVGVRIGRLGQSVSTLQNAIVIDPLTRLKNRRYFGERLGQELARARREGTKVALIVADLDHFKGVNDLHGHVTGDAVLRTIAGVMSQCCRSADSACRVGGEEFALILPNTEPLEGARVAERLRTAIAACRIDGAKGEIHPTISLGLAVSDENLRDVDALFAAADRAMYRAKLAGRNCVMLDEAIEPIGALGARWSPRNIDA